MARSRGDGLPMGPPVAWRWKHHPRNRDRRYRAVPRSPADPPTSNTCEAVTKHRVPVRPSLHRNIVDARNPSHRIADPQSVVKDDTPARQQTARQRHGAVGSRRAEDARPCPTRRPWPPASPAEMDHPGGRSAEIGISRCLIKRRPEFADQIVGQNVGGRVLAANPAAQGNRHPFRVRSGSLSWFLARPVGFDGDGEIGDTPSRTCHNRCSAPCRLPRAGYTPSRSWWPTARARLSGRRRCRSGTPCSSSD